MKKTVKISILISLIVFAVCAYLFDVGSYFEFETISAYKNQLLNKVTQHRLLSLLLFILCYALTLTLSLPGAASLSLLGGFLFGIIHGTFANIIGATCGALGSFAIARHLLGKEFQKTYAPQLAHFNNELQKYGSFYLFIIRLLPVFPFFIVNFMCGLTNIATQTFAVTTIIGIIPGALAYTIAGNSLRTASSIKDIFSLPFIIAALMLIALALLGLWYKKTTQDLSTT